MAFKMKIYLERRYFIPLLLSLCFVGLFLGQETAFAGTLYSQLGKNIEIDASVGSYNSYFQSFGDGLSGVLDEICIYGRKGAAFDDNLILRAGNTSNFIYSEEIWSQNNLSFSSTDAENCFNVGEITLNPAKFYFLVVTGYPGSNFYFYANSDENSWDSADFNLFKVPDTPVNQHKDIYFKFNAPLQNSVSLNTIPNSTSSQTITFNWNYHLDSAVQFQSYYSIYPDFDLYLCSSSASSTCQILESGISYSDQIPNSHFGTATTTITLSNGYYQIKNFEVGYDTIGNGNLDSHILITEPSNVFQINYEISAPTITFPTSTITTSTPIQITCDPNSGFFSYSFCNFFAYLFIPSTDSFNRFTTLRNEIGNKPPIGYFTQIKNVLSSVNASGTPVFNIGNYTPLNNSIFTPLKTGLTWLLWLFFIVVIFNRIRHLDL